MRFTYFWLELRFRGLLGFEIEHSSGLMPYNVTSAPMLVDSILIFAKFFMTIEYPSFNAQNGVCLGPARPCQASLSILRQWRCCTNRNLKCKCGSIWFQARFFFSLPLFQSRSVSNDIVNKALQIAGILSGGYNW